MTTITAFEAKTRFGELLDRASKGEEIVITRYDKPVARMVPNEAFDRDRNRSVFEGMRRLQEKMVRRGMKPLSDAEIRSARDEGRK